MTRAVHQFIPGVLRRDGVGDEVLAWRDIFRAAGYQSEIFVGEASAGGEGEPLSAYDGDARNLMLCHHAIGNDFVGLLEPLPDQRVLRFHNLTPSRFFPANLPMQHSIKLGWRQVRYLRDLVVGSLCASTFNAASLRRYGYPEPVIVPSCFSLGRLRGLGALSEAEGRRDEPLVLCVARGAANKRLDHVVQAFEHFAQRFAPRARLALVGDLYADFDCGATLAERLRRSPVRERIEIPGSVSDRELADYYRRARLYLSMSEHEGFCIPPLEAFGCDVPVLAYQTPAVAETMAGAGILFTRKAWDEVAALMAELCFDETLRARVIAAQRERLTRPDITGARARLLEAVEGWLPAATAAPAHRRRRLVDRIGVVSPYDSVSEVASCTRGLAAAFRASGTPVTILAPSSESSWGPDPAHVLRIVSDRPAAYVSAAIEHGIRVVHQMVQPATGMHTVHTCRVITAFRDAGVPVYVTVHGPLFRGAPFLQPLIDSAPTFADCAGVFVHDPADADVLRELGLDDVRTLSFGVPTLPSTDSAPLRAALGLGNRRVVAFVGSATTHGGLREAIQAMFLLHDRYPDVLLVAVPTAARDPGGWYLGECRDRIERLGLSSSIYLFDRPMSDAVAATLLQAADVVLVPASLDGFSTSLRWPLASGRAVVAPAWLGGERMRDAVHPLAAVTPQHLARGLDAVLSDDRLRAARQAGAQRLAETHSWSQVAEEYLGGCDTPLRRAAAG